MPKEVTRYVCEACDAEYELEEDALECEESHIHTAGISEEFFDCGDDVPKALDVNMTDGSVLRYALVLGGRR